VKIAERESLESQLVAEKICQVIVDLLFVFLETQLKAIET